MSKYLTRLTDKFRNRKVWERPEPCKVLAFIPGTIQKIMVEEGMEVHEKTPLLILEAMKMYNELLSPQHGVIEKIHVAEGDRVAKGHLLLEFRQV
ncbi:MAG TPA: acetyl-CoA carboxylase biotin carboxyl carrier protein subunit [Bacteroides sp.]|nr:acetyl-CoA carboxylase biotin carboxyl carrier protein subunit [Bacteroides sp.]